MDQDALIFKEDSEIERETPGGRESFSDVIGLLDAVLSSEPTDIGGDRSWLHNTINTLQGPGSTHRTKSNDEGEVSTPSIQDNRSGEESGISGGTGKPEAETHAGNVDKQNIHRAAGRGTGTNSVPQDLGNGGNSGIPEDPPNERGYPRSGAEDENREMAANPDQRREDQAEGLPEEVRGSTPLLDEGESRADNNGRSVEPCSPHSARLTGVLVIPSPELEEAVLKRNKRRPTNNGPRPSTPAVVSNIRSPSPGHDNNTKSSPGKPPITQDENTNSGDAPSVRTKDRRPPTGTRPAPGRPTDSHPTHPGPEADATKKGIGENTSSMKELATLLMSLGVTQSAQEFESSRDASYVFARRALKSANYAEMTFNICGLILSAEKSFANRVDENKQLLKQIQESMESFRDIHKRFSEYQKEQNSLLMSNLSTLHIITDRGGKIGNTEPPTRSPSVFAKTKENKTKITRFDPSMETLGDMKYKPDLLREDEFRDEIRNPVYQEGEIEPKASNASRLLPSKEKPTLHSLRLVIESSPLSRAEKAAYVKSLSKCKTDREVKEVMELVEEDIESLTN
ncbi:P protein [Pangolin respirovirus]|nr:P protein [Pangolin respirovirus]WEU70830.1 MAG: phosphoprotein [Pangolin respirovirus]WEU70836.1 MAG: phosphoprotein [Pangolin respirovirus]WEU70849.1 MAG: phosphoprotein [Pangolin respirovirus]WEU70856.1 MAG: phosphoprotein [Pangolin respirovirus]